MTRSCCFISRLSATMAFAPPGPKSLARVVNRCKSKKTRSLMVQQGRADNQRAQDLSFVCFYAEVTIRHPQVGAVRSGRVNRSRRIEHRQTGGHFFGQSRANRNTRLGWRTARSFRHPFGPSLPTDPPSKTRNTWHTHGRRSVGQELPLHTEYLVAEDACHAA